jgi:hypothetical protein
MSKREAVAGQPEPVVQEPEAALERLYIEQYLRQQGHTLQSLHALPKKEAERLMVEASTYASGRLAEVETRAHFLRDLHSGGSTRE